MAVTTTSALALRPRADLVNHHLSRERYKRLLSHPLWALALRVINRTRSYEAGLEGGYLLLELLKRYSSSLTPKERDDYFQKVYALILSMLDKLDRWEEYLELWDQLRITTRFELTYARQAAGTWVLLADARCKETEQSRQRSLWEKRRSFMLREDKRYVYLHWLYLRSRRRDIIIRKLERRLAGISRRSDIHARQEDLTENEMRYRLQEFERIVRRTLATA